MGACAETGALAVMGGEVSCGVRRLPKRQPRVPGAGTSAFAGVVHFVWTKYGRSFDATPQGRVRYWLRLFAARVRTISSCPLARNA